MPVDGDYPLLYRFTVGLPFRRGHRGDEAQNVFHFAVQEDNPLETINETIGVLAQFYGGGEIPPGVHLWGNRIARYVRRSGCWIDVDQINPATAKTIRSRDRERFFIHDASDYDDVVDYPSEISLKLRLGNVSHPEIPLRRRLGGLYLGPWAVNHVADTFVEDTTEHESGRGPSYPSPSEELRREVLLGAAASFRRIGDGGLPGLGGAVWVVYSRAQGDFFEVDWIWCDNEWRVQRRREMRATVEAGFNLHDITGLTFPPIPDIGDEGEE